MTRQKYVPTNQGISLVGAQDRIGIRYVRTSELAQKGWVDFELKFYSDAQAVWEYRVFSNDGLYNKPDNIGRFGDNVRIFFDNVKIYKISEMELPAV